jgi:hypothetical protein
MAFSSITRHIFDLCKSISDSPDRTALQLILTGKCHGEDSLGPTYADIDYATRKQGMQFLGPLLLHQERNRSLAQHCSYTIIHLDRGAFELLYGAHKQIVDFNRKVVKDVVRRYPHWSTVLDPYSDCMDLLIPSGLSERKPLYQSGLDTAALALRELPCIRNLLTLRSSLSEPSFSILYKNVLQLQSELIFCGPLQSPERLLRFVHSEAVNSNTRQMFGIIACLASLRSTLGMVNQMIFQKVIEDQMLSFSSNNVFKADSASHLCGQGLQLHIQSDHRTGLILETGNIVFVNPVSDIIDRPLLAEICETSMTWDAEMGDRYQLRLRKLDGNFCKYGSFWHLLTFGDEAPTIASD